MPIPVSTQDFEKLNNLKQVLEGQFKETIKKRLGLDLYQTHVAQYLEDFIINIESSLGTLAEESIHDEELCYESFDGE